MDRVYLFDSLRPVLVVLHGLRPHLVVLDHKLLPGVSISIVLVSICSCRCCAEGIAQHCCASAMHGAVVPSANLVYYWLQLDEPSICYRSLVLQ